MALGWDEDDVMVRSDRLPKIPVTKQTGALNKKARHNLSPRNVQYMASANNHKQTNKHAYKRIFKPEPPRSSLNAESSH